MPVQSMSAHALEHQSYLSIHWLWILSVYTQNDSKNAVIDEKLSITALEK